MMIDFISAAFEVALSFEPVTLCVWACLGFACVWRLVWYLVGGMTHD